MSNTEELRSLLIEQAGLKKHVRSYENGRRTQRVGSGFLSNGRVESVKTRKGTVIIYDVPVAYVHTERREYGPRDESPIDKFFRRVDKNPDGHWYWVGHCSSQGYGRFSIKVAGKNKTVAAHRWLYEQLVRKLDSEEVLDHVELCRIRNCVNPEHLDPTSPGENARRGRVRLSLRDRVTCNAGHILADVGVRVDERGTVLCKQCERDKMIRSASRFFARRAEICYLQGLDNIVCEHGHRLDVERALLRSGLCRECHRLGEARSRAARLSS